MNRHEIKNRKNFLAQFYANYFAKIVKYTAPKVALPDAWKGRVAYAADWNSVETNAVIERLFAGVDDAPAA